MKIHNYILIFGALVISSIIYAKVNKKNEMDISKYYLKMIDKFLINGGSSGLPDKPFLWIHLHNNNTIIPDVNARNWLNFVSRGTKDFNQPYQTLTIKSIINNCGRDFNICLINDHSFKNILPNWALDLPNIAEPIRTHLRHLAIANVLNIYGGIVVPSSFICFKSLKPLYKKYILKNKLFVGEFKNNSTIESAEGTLPSPMLIGCNNNNDTIKSYISFLEILNSTNFSASTECTGKINAWFNSLPKEQVSVVEAKSLGVKTTKNELVLIDDLMSNTYIDICKCGYGLYIPWDELINRTAYEWFVKLMPEDVLKSNTNIGKYLLKGNCNL